MSKAAMKLALEALIGARAFLESDAPVEIWGVNDKAITALREALANEALDKMAENSRELGLDYEVEPKIGCVNHDCDKCKALAEQPAQRTWAGLSTKELESGAGLENAKSTAELDLSKVFWAGARWAEAKLKDKNNA